MSVHPLISLITTCSKPNRQLSEHSHCVDTLTKTTNESEEYTAGTLLAADLARLKPPTLLSPGAPYLGEAGWFVASLRAVQQVKPEVVLLRRKLVRLLTAHGHRRVAPDHGDELRAALRSLHLAEKTRSRSGRFTGDQGLSHPPPPPGRGKHTHTHTHTQLPLKCPTSTSRSVDVHATSQSASF